MHFCQSTKGFNILKIYQKKRQIQSGANVRVRFAPSPTGFIHFGGLRTALINYIFAKQNNGKFILRIEDTDQDRVIPGAVENILESLRWAGISPDEGDHIPGDHGPYTQSLRLPIYAQYITKLLQLGKAYHCFCSVQRVAGIRAAFKSSGKSSTYDGFCRNLSAREVTDNIQRELPYTIRLNMDESPVSWNDGLYGLTRIPYDYGDHIIVKSDGWPTYHFANVIDDRLMQITHVFRGIEWQPSVPKHLCLYQAFGWTPPQLTHLPLILDEQGNKISKRNLSANSHILHYRDYFPEAVLNYILSVGGGIANYQPMSVSQIIERFDVNKMLRHSSRLSADKLSHFNRSIIQFKVRDPSQMTSLVTSVKQLIISKYKNINLDYEMLKSPKLDEIISWASKDRICTMNDLLDDKFIFLWVYPLTTSIELCAGFKFSSNKVECGRLVNDFIDKMVRASDWTEDSVSLSLKEFMDSYETSMKRGELLKFIRIAISGMLVGPPVTDMLYILGKETVLKRLGSMRNLI